MGDVPAVKKKEKKSQTTVRLVPRRTGQERERERQRRRSAQEGEPDQLTAYNTVYPSVVHAECIQLSRSERRSSPNSTVETPLRLCTSSGLLAQRHIRNFGIEWSADGYGATWVDVLCHG